MSEEVTPNREYQMARLILAVVNFLVEARSIKEDMHVASRLFFLRRLYKPPLAS